ncbi:MAG: PQQ-dependent sugar dehydrogenase [Acidimicrobiales bacterium]
MGISRAVFTSGFAALALLGACGGSSDDPITAETTDDATSGNTTSEETQSSADGGTSAGSDDSTQTTEEAAAAETSANDEPPTQLPATVGPWGETVFDLEPVGSLTQPIALTNRPGSEHLWVAERDGRVRLIERVIDVDAGTEQFVQTTEVVVDITDKVNADGEGGLLGIAFSADGSLLYLHYTDTDFTSIVSEMPMAETTADRNAERVLLEVPQPFRNHNGGDLHLGPDGLLYTGFGDGGSGDDPLDSGQDTETVLGAMLRLDPTPSGDTPYTVPADNPFATSGGAPEIWAWGLRNPWRFSFDQATGDLWIGDVGQGRVEEIDFAANTGDGSPGRAANFGWNRMEGNESFTGEEPADHVGPIHTYTHESERCSVTGGYVYRGALTLTLSGVYVFADYCSNELFGIERLADGSNAVSQLILNRAPQNVISFGQGPDGEVYVLEIGGRISRLQGPDVALETSLSSR